jgi:hypothetical protein
MGIPGESFTGLMQPIIRKKAVSPDPTAIFHNTLFAQSATGNAVPLWVFS